MIHLSPGGNIQILLPVYNDFAVASDCISLALLKSWKEGSGSHLGKNFSFCPKVLTTPLLHTTEKLIAIMWAQIVPQLLLLEYWESLRSESHGLISH